MAIDDLDTLKSEVTQLVEPFVGHAMSQQNFVKFSQTLRKIFDVQGLQRYITNFMLAGAGMAASESLDDALSNLIVEGVMPQFTARQRQLSGLVGKYGYYTKLTN